MLNLMPCAVFGSGSNTFAFVYQFFFHACTTGALWWGEFRKLPPSYPAFPPPGLAPLCITRFGAHCLWPGAVQHPLLMSIWQE